jgi:LysM repeat protein
VPHAAEDKADAFAALERLALDERPPRDGPIEYIIEQGDTLLLLAERFGLRLETLVWANDLADADLILAGHRLRIPPTDGLYYTVQYGDRLGLIADRFGLPVDKILGANRIQDADRLLAGRELWLPNARPLTAERARPGIGIAPGEALEPLTAPPPNLEQILSSGWLATSVDTVLYRTPARHTQLLHRLPANVRLERVSGLAGARLQVRDPGDGQTRQAMTGWVDVRHLEPGRAPPAGSLARGYPYNTRMDIAHVFVPHRAQLDGGPWGGANCGPAALSMILAAFGVDIAPAQLRPAVLNAQGMHGHRIGTLLTALAAVGERKGVQIFDLYQGDTLKRWSLDDIRAHLSQGRPVLAQVYFRRLPGYEAVPYYGDHYIVITGALDEGFLYNDPLNHDGPGWDRVISNQRLEAAMDASDRRFRQAAFAAAARQ